ncbi:glycoside hydrolase family 32 protein [Pasteurellaceae bacterium USgator11]|nr:glycoside hydrolase family 32 protein [Pasteurellaceae bacterium UScroc12]TNG96949.1 glycoside hydrolase family 32 protein [Pasteurellaceae bacterium USgator41]TNG97550.1 glycoside hydrolase family 32 protein [Pasteurellaceae bacterium UScroc31]TNH01776.1 glycoside hydrolase family 32 protein [Pasteurellaceae bacterium USgator11]
MLIFNQGKYKSLLAAEEGELDAVAAQVATDQDFRPDYHLVAPFGLINDPNGLVFDGEKYHIFYQWYPYGAMHGMKHWLHYTTPDFQQFTLADTLIPTEMFESHGCYSGGALPLGGCIAAFYTGNTRRSSDNARIPYQNIAVFSNDGKLLDKYPLVTCSPAGYSEHVRDPKPYFTLDGKVRFICGAQRDNLSGTAIVFEMENINTPPQLLGELSLSDFDNRNIFMWECPDLLKIGEKDLFIWSPQGKQREAQQFQNNYHSTYVIGKLNDLQFEVEQFGELDYGFDFYAPQTFAGLDNSESAVMIGWVGLPDLQYPTDEYGWHSTLTMPRRLSVKNNRIYQTPLEQYYPQNLTALSLQQTTTLADLDRRYLKFSPHNTDFSLQLFDNPQGQHLTLSYQNGVFCLDRSASEQSESMLSLGEQRYCAIGDLQQVEIFIDRSVIEIFLNGGEKALTSRFFIKNRQNMLQSSCRLEIESAVLAPIEYRTE